MNQTAIHRLLAEYEEKQITPARSEELFRLRLAANLSIIKHLFSSLYPEDEHPGMFDKLVNRLPLLFSKRPKELRALDLERTYGRNDHWYQSEQLVGMQLYVDHFSDNLPGLISRLPYFEELGVNFLHLMPLTTRPAGENDGGYAVNSYTEIEKRLGSKKDLLRLTKEMRKRGMYLMLDFVVNHTSDEFSWAQKAKQGDSRYRDYYYTYPDRDIPDQFERTMPEVFPETSPGNFTYNPEMQHWVMTVFNKYQWDLNYANPEVFIEMISILLEKINYGVDVVRFDALAFLWKKLGTSSQNLPEAHMLISLFRLCMQVLAPGVIILAEAIVAPKDITKYFGNGILEGNECDVAYNASLMALLWNSVATKKTNLLYKSLRSVPEKPDSATWINYVRCHDDIGLGYDDQLIEELGWNAQSHRRFLLEYYCQRLHWSPAKGMMFMYNPKNGDGRITGSTASLLGLEKALELQDEEMKSHAIAKILLLHGIILSFGGIPMIYAGDEIGTLNDYSFLQIPDKKEDTRWLNRPRQNWETIAELGDSKNETAEIFYRLKHLISLRKELPVLADRNNLQLHNTGNPHILAYERTGPGEKGLLVICNFDEAEQVIDAGWVHSLGYGQNSGFKDLISGSRVELSSGLLPLPAYGQLWIVKD
ncbi:alpha-amylase family glycosyl hydrolase [Zeaxanthinibacter enoshimensis]|uniref:Amylosucrase n=1 Tax=Zeaxanthinibacter enoshimensis TaxID=392009 RepID=A0A4R6TPA7_9FLAO|nr:alpha-amylase family glycosyl hydrolase [Zeaxanthinibacter enoshimensis]TDQ32950.1 amylosucrase [Zeaxanthinibacter enoshimensis]